MTEQYSPKILDILVWPDDRLHLNGEDVTEFDDDLEHLVADLFATMVAHEGVGLAATQCNIQKNIIVIRIEQDNPFVLINPKISAVGEDKFNWEEGCLSVPGYFEKNDRPNRIFVEYQGLDGEKQNVEFRDLYAFAIQHEYDHLQGKVFVDGASWFKKGKIEKKIQKALKKQKLDVESLRQQLYSSSTNSTEG